MIIPNKIRISGQDISVVVRNSYDTKKNIFKRK